MLWVAMVTTVETVEVLPMEMAMMMTDRKKLMMQLPETVVLVEVQTLVALYSLAEQKPELHW